MTTVLDSARGGAAFVWHRRRLRIALLALLVALPLLGCGWLWLRHSSLVAVQRIRISGVRGPDAARIEVALGGAARHMSTLDVRRGALLAAVAQFPVVRDLSVSASFPHGLRIRVIEQPPVAVLVAGGTRTAVAADGVVLGAALLAGSLPTIHAAGVGPLPGARVSGASTRAELSVLGAVPGTLLGWVERVFTGSEGLTVTMRDGLSIYFGNATRAHAKWLAAARVLADPSSAGASYLDVRLPERPAAGTTAAGGLRGSSSTPTQVSASDPTAAALAATLDEAVAGSSGASTAAPAPSEPVAATQSEAATGAQSEPAAGAVSAGEPSGTGASSTGTGEAPASTAESASSETSTSTSG